MCCIKRHLSQNLTIFVFSLPVTMILRIQVHKNITRNTFSKFQPLFWRNAARKGKIPKITEYFARRQYFLFCSHILFVLGLYKGNLLTTQTHTFAGDPFRSPVLRDIDLYTSRKTATKAVFHLVERKTGFGPATSTLARLRSTT